jgi:hypothetical protein
MSDTFDFEQYWLQKFSRCLDECTSEDIRKQVMEGSDHLSDQTDRRQVITWSNRAIERMVSLSGVETAQRVMTGCGCQYPPSQLQEIKEAFAQTQDLALAHRMLQEQFEQFIRNDLDLAPEIADQVLDRDWGLAGTLQGNTIIATKIPKSGYLADYMQESDPQARREMYCHCPRVRDVLRTGEPLSDLYCYCGAGFYKGIWKEILSRPVEVEVLESVLGGGDVCKIAIRVLPELAS